MPVPLAILLTVIIIAVASRCVRKETGKLMSCLYIFGTMVAAFFVAGFMGVKRAKIMDAEQSKILWNSYIVRIIQHPPPNERFYTVTTRNHPTNEVAQFGTIELSPCRFVVDVASNMPMWMTYSVNLQVIHVHSLDEIQTRPRTAEEEVRLRYVPPRKPVFYNPLLPRNLQH